MNTPDIDQIFDDDEPWLAEQPGMQPWDEGRCRLVELLDRCLRRYSAFVRERPAEPASGDQPIYLARLWQCLGYHWRDALGPSPTGDPPHASASTSMASRRAGEAAVQNSTDGRITADQVAEQIAAGQGYRGGGRLGGDPLRDIVLAVAVVRKDGRAAQVFQDDYYEFAVAVAKKVDQRLAADPDPWWSELLDELAGYTGPKAKLDQFKGRCALQNWLPRVIVRFVYRWPLDSSTGPQRNDPPDQPQPPSESLAIFSQIVRDAVAGLSSDDQLVLKLIHVDRLKNQQAAAILGVAPGTATRRHQKALSRFRAAIMELAGSRLSEDAYTGVLEDLQSEPRLFGIILCEALEGGTGSRAETCEAQKGAIPS